MKILLVGEYSNLHNSLKAGLEKLGNDVTLAGNGDGFKNYPVDIKIDHSFYNPILKKIKTGLFKFFGFDLISLEIYLKIILWSKRLKGYDVVQLINESPFKCRPKTEIRIIKRLLKHNSSLFLLSCGVDHPSVKYMSEENFKYSIMTPYLEKKSVHKDYAHILQFLDENYMNLHHFLYKNINGVIASDLDYHLPLKGRPKYLGIISNPINLDNISYRPMIIEDRIKIFHGINTRTSFKKGNNYFTEALELIKEKYKNKIEIITSEDVPYKVYINSYTNCHILLDQVYAYDQGYNALEAMAKGKVVFTGAEREWLDYYELEEDTVAINAIPNSKKIADKLERLILNPQKILEISKNARTFVEKHHDYIKVAQEYQDIWANNQLKH